MARKPTIIWTALPLGQSSVVAETTAVVIGPGGHLDVEVDIDNGAGAAPSDAPLGVWQLWTCTGTAPDDARYKQVLNIQALTTALATLAPNGNAVVGGTITLRGLAGRFAKIRYQRSSGGSATVTGTASRARVTLTVDDA